MKQILLLLVAFSFVLQLNAKQRIIVDGAELVLVKDGFKFTEGPTPDALGNIYFSDIPTNSIYKIDLEGQVSLFTNKVKGCNGLKFDKGGCLWVCGNSGGKEIYKIDIKTKQIKTVITDYKGKKFNGPNDLWITRTGAVYFTDPTYGRNRTDIELDDEDVYYIAPGSKEAVLAASDFVRPNGLIGTKNEKYLYIADMGGSMTYRFDVEEDGSLVNRTLFCEKGSDGMAIDVKGNVYLTNGKNVYIYSKKGKLVKTIDMPGHTTNICFGGRDGKTVFITTAKAVYSLKMNVKGLGR